MQINWVLCEAFIKNLSHFFEFLGALNDTFLVVLGALNIWTFFEFLGALNDTFLVVLGALNIWQDLF